MPFIRGGYSKDGGSLLQRSVSSGLGYQARGSDLLGIAFNWGQANESTFASDLPDQYGVEWFYRFQLADELAITPNLQYLRNPALDPDQDSVWVVGLRARFAL
jgi:porin